MLFKIKLKHEYITHILSAVWVQLKTGSLGKISRITELLKNRKENNEATPGKDPTNFLQHGL